MSVVFCTYKQNPRGLFDIQEKKMSYITPCAAFRPDGTTELAAAGETTGAENSKNLVTLPSAEAIDAGELTLPSLAEVGLAFDKKERILWQYMMPQERPSFTCSLLSDMKRVLDFVERTVESVPEGRDLPIGYIVLASAMPTIFNLGGDLPHFIRLIETQNREELTSYARTCAYGQYRRATNMNLPLCSIALVQGDALGGGFEGVLAQDVIIAERSANFGLPEVLFNMFPGMGALSYLSRRLDLPRAERMVLSGKIYTAEELHEMGVVDVLVDDGKGEAAVYDFVRTFERSAGTRLGVLKARQMIHPVPLKELVDIADLWVDTALRLDASDLRRMRHLAKAQDRRWERLIGRRQSSSAR
jgi:DSF synthase